MPGSQCFASATWVRPATIRQPQPANVSGRINLRIQAEAIATKRPPLTLATPNWRSRRRAKAKTGLPPSSIMGARRRREPRAWILWPHLLAQDAPSMRTARNYGTMLAGLGRPIVGGEHEPTRVHDYCYCRRSHRSCRDWLLHATWLIEVRAAEPLSGAFRWPGKPQSCCASDT